MSTTSAQATAVVTGSFLSGAMISLSLMAVPVLLDTTTEPTQLFFQWRRMYHYGHQVLPTMAVATTLLYAYTASKRRRAQKPSWAVFALAGTITVSMIPFTWLCMVPTNNVLFGLEAATRLGEPSGMGIEEAQALLVKWSWLHFTRSLMPLMGAILGSLGETVWN
uniref:Anthrone oxygenase AgnL2 n=1 Tax=Paecilomyces divaricatus TaxID=644132 RepID=AGN2_PAEDI|nr:RecName: Full=Anthrone oxygenase AgnL2; AltName: Full=Agnestins biosynthesis cluster protein L2 [Paecilomyces divaricatus]QBG38886.1 anthrone oxidase [Paecilomyces divaricatus]